MPRLFFALWPDDQTRNQLGDIADQFKDENLRQVKKSNLHMTLEFLGEVSDDVKAELIEGASGIQLSRFDLELTRVGWWRKPQVLWIGTTQVPDELLMLVKAIRRCVKQSGLKPEQREYRPHVTIARKVKQVTLPKETFNLLWHVDRFALVLSRTTDSNVGVEYHVVKYWSLQS